MSKTIMIATLGGQPQLVTMALDRLRQNGSTVSAVIVLHMAAEGKRIQNALSLLSREFSGGLYQGEPCSFQPLALTIDGQPLSGIRNGGDADAAGQVVRGLLSNLKSEGHELHLCISGGRRIVALLVMSAAALLCDHRDHLWHMYAPDDFVQRSRHGAILHAKPEDGLQLIEVPLVPWGTYFPGLRAMAQAPEEAIARQMGWLRTSQEQCEQVYTQLTERQREVLIAFAQGYTPQEVADSLSISMATVNTHKTPILDECRNAWEIEPNEWLDYHFIREHFEPYVQQLVGTSS